MYTSGALLLSNDGDFIYKITHPKHEISKTYNVTIQGIIWNDEINLLKNGIIIDNNGKPFKTSPAQVHILKVNKEKNISRIQIKIHEGKNRQIRKMCLAINKKILALHRSEISSINVKGLKLGEWRYL